MIVHWFFCDLWWSFDFTSKLHLLLSSFLLSDKPDQNQTRPTQLDHFLLALQPTAPFAKLRRKYGSG